jgi:hypothetical protein
MPALLTKALWTAYALEAWPGSPLIRRGSGNPAGTKPADDLADRADGIKFLLRAVLRHEAGLKPAHGRI